MEWKISKNEINRRKKAYITLSISLIVGLFLSSIIFNFPVLAIAYIVVVGVVLSIGAFSFRFFHFLLQTRISLSEKYLTREGNLFHEEYLLTKINRAKIKWTTNGTIREIYIWSSDGKSVFITGLDRFEEFRKNLLEKINKGAVVKEIQEILDFDHSAFYPALGLIISGIGVYTVKLISNFNSQSMQVSLLAFSIYVFVLGIYFIVFRPISRRLGNQKRIQDYIFGAIIVCAGLFILILLLSQFTPSILSQ